MVGSPPEDSPQYSMVALLQRIILVRYGGSPPEDSPSTVWNELTDHVGHHRLQPGTICRVFFSTHNFSVDTSAFLDLFSPSLGVPDLSLPDLDSSLASIQELLSSQEQKASETEPRAVDTGKQIVHYKSQPLILMDSSGSDLPIFLELEGGEPYLAGDDDDCSEDPTLSLLSWDTQSKSNSSESPRNEWIFPGIFLL
ncbi:heat shock factor protein 1-like [Rhinophrynus dorsalis]